MADVELSAVAMARGPVPMTRCIAGSRCRDGSRPPGEASRIIGIDGQVHELRVLDQNLVFDLIALNQDWGFVGVLRDAIGRRPGFTLTIFGGEGHAVGITHAAEILAQLARD